MRRSHTGIKLLTLTTAAALTLAACGGSDDDKDASSGGKSQVPECLSFNDLYALIGPEAEGVTNWKDAEPLAKELGSATKLPDADLTITGPGEESGTYGSFVDLVVKGIAETRAEEGKITEDQVETTRKDYESSANDNVIIDGVANNEGSLGWVGFAFADLNADSVRSLQVDGGEGCVAPNPDTIADGSYPLARPLYIYVNTAKAEENPAVAAFIDYYLGDAGYESVSEADYIPLDESAWGETQAAWEETGLSGADTGDLSGEITVSGSSTVEPISRNVAERFSSDNGDVAISVEGPGTSDGIEQFCAGEIDIANASRAIKDEEITACADAGIEYVELQVAIDGLSIITQA